MKNKSKQFSLSLIISFIFILSVNAKVQIKELDFSKINNTQAKLSVKFVGKMTGEPELSVRDSIVQVEIPGAVVWPKIEKKVTIGKNKFDTTLMAYQFDKDLARVRVILPFSAQKNNHKINFTIKNNRIDINFPTVAPKLITNALKYDESYLEQLLQDKKENKIKGTAATAVKNDLSNFLNNKNAKKKIDVVKRKTSAIKKKDKWGSGFSIGSFVSKVVAFFAVVLLLFYGFVTLIKKGAFKKSRLGFLNNTKVVQVLSTTYIAPKRSIMMIQAHDQVFLVGNSEKGMHFLSEVNNVAGLMKNGEQEVTGVNFDSTMVTADTDDKPQVIKENIQVSKEETNPLTSFLSSASGEKEKLSDKIKSKVKNLKSLQ